MPWYLHPVLVSALGGALTATAIDRQAFAAFKSLDDVAAYNWGTAALRFVQGLIIGAATADSVGHFAP